MQMIHCLIVTSIQSIKPCHEVSGIQQADALLPKHATSLHICMQSTSTVQMHVGILTCHRRLVLTVSTGNDCDMVYGLQCLQAMLEMSTHNDSDILGIHADYISDSRGKNCRIIRQ